MPSQIVIIVAAGSGSRFGSELPKQFIPLCGKPVVFHAIETFRQTLPEARILIVLSSGMIPYWKSLCDKHCFASPEIVSGGATRWESVKSAIEAISDAPASTLTLIHDGARPLVSPEVIRHTISCSRNTDGAIPAIEVTDSLRTTDNDGIDSQPVDRSRFRAVQTPQTSALWRLREAYALPYQPDFTDDASVLAAAGFTNVVLTPGSRENIKITTPVDLLLAEAIIKSRPQ